MHTTIDPAILYFGTPVILVSSTNPDGSTNIAPMSSAWWLGRSCMLGFGARSQTPQNIRRTEQCVLNLPSVDQVSAVDRLARLTGSDPVPTHKRAMGYRYERDKLGVAELTEMSSELVTPPRIAECPVQLEAVLDGTYAVAEKDPLRKGGNLVALECRVVRVHIEESLRLEGHNDRIDPIKWRPLIMSFCHFFGLGPIVHPSRLAEIPESSYRPPPPHIPPKVCTHRETPDGIAGGGASC